ncbi:ABC transporter ATP-binding protein [Pseudohongiella sp.]|uniref:ABC transporter domain-containing protein n=1 Tax=marine sediment metagenome TaxID=412755 RepID=A0A0F9W3A8_9ZZZZ|nr:ABC transporter ATP-binding protein [Pseudohongiella sp.]HDZ08379.1 ABC transporter ATP-binding protein [Pseudohongiella sp.]HEA61900.1 ABC transporter ATP-binding protein [Pseudohongiella sp.]
MLELAGVSKRVGNEDHIRDVSLQLERGSMNVLLGPTLSGKTSLMRLMAGLDKPTRGDILLDGVSVLGIPVQKRRVAMVYQQFINYPTLTIYENIASPLRVARLAAADIDKKVRHAADLLRLTEFLDKRPAELSGGQQQRTAIARALVKESQLVLLDEPLANLDYKLREELRQELPRIFAELGAILVYASTEPSEALLLGGNTATLHQGRVTQFGATIDVFQQPVDLVTARTFSDPPLNTAPVSKRGAELRLDRFVIPLSAAQAAMPDANYTLGLRPWHLTLEGSADCTVEGQVKVTEITGSETYIHLHVADQPWVSLTHGIRHLDVDTSQLLHFSPENIYLFDETGHLVMAPRSPVPVSKALLAEQAWQK